MAKIGFYGGCFSPPTKAHIGLAQMAIKEYKLDKVVFVPVGDLYEKDNLEKLLHRYNMLKIACRNSEVLQVSDIESRTNICYKAIDIFEKLKESHKQDEIYFLMGADNLEKLPQWKNSQKLAENYRYIVFDRGTSKVEEIIENNKILKMHKSNFSAIKTSEFEDCSSRQIREKIKKGQKPDDLDENVYLYIKENSIYL